MKQRNVAIYARVSTDDQDASRQRADLRAWAQQMGWNVVVTANETASGASQTRAIRRELISIAKSPTLAKLLTDPRKKVQVHNITKLINGGHNCKLDAILVTELSRWSRSTVDLVATLDDLASHGVSVLTLSGLSLDMSTPTGRLTATVLAGVAEFERALIVERTKSGLAHAKAQGKALGRPPGSRSKAWKHYKTVIATHYQGVSIRSIANRYGIPPSTIKRMIDHHKANKPTSPVVD